MDYEGRAGPGTCSGLYAAYVCFTCALQLSNDPSLSSLPLLLVFLKSYSRPYLGIVPPSAAKQVSAAPEQGTLSGTASEEATQANGAFPTLLNESEELVEKEIRDRFKKMCEGYFDNVAKKLVIEHNVSVFIPVYAAHTHGNASVCKSRTGGITKHIFGLARSSRTDSKLMRR